MAELHSAFVGEIPHNYEKYLGPLIFSEYAIDLAERASVPSNGLLLEIAAGTGMATRQLRDSNSQDVHIIATDLNEDMLKVAKSKFSSDENIEFQMADAFNLPFTESTFDAVACQFSVMFFPEKLTALQEAARVLKPGGKFYFNIWDALEHNHLAQLVNKVVTSFLPDNPPDFFNVPYGFYKIDAIKKLLIEAGFSDIEISILPRVSISENARNVAMGFVMGTPVRLQIEQIAPELLPTIVNAVEKAVEQDYGTKQVQAKMQAMVFTAHYPKK